MPTNIQQIDAILEADPSKEMPLWRLVNIRLEQQGQPPARDPRDLPVPGRPVRSIFHVTLLEVEGALAQAGRYLYPPDEIVGLTELPRYNQRISRIATLANA